VTIEQWQPIGTAPRDGSQIQFYEPSRPDAPDDSRRGTCYWDTKHGEWNIDYGGGLRCWPTLWQPLPELPEGL
jgi:hypothetical protein